MDVCSLTVEELETLARSPWATEELSPASGVAALVVHVDGHHDNARVRALLGELPCVSIAVGVSHLASAFDVSLAASEDLESLTGAVAAKPVAASAFALLLRASERRSVPDGLVAESATYSMLQAGSEFVSWRDARPAHRVPPDETPPVRTQREGSILHVTLDRPRRHNAFSSAMRDALAAALATAVVDDTITVVVLEGTGPSFCSGGDLDEFGSFPDPARAHLIRLSRSPARLIASLAPRVEVHLHGACIGAGIELPAFARRVVAHPDTVISLPEVALGLVPGAGGTVSLPRRIGRQRTAWLGLSGARIDARTALAWGLVDELSGSRARL